MEERRLTAILFSDISGYSTLMGENEEKALALLEKNRKIHRFMVRSFHGRVIDEIGDGTFACFNSAMDAVQCAVEVLRASHEDPRLRLHIGIHLAEVVISGNKVYGDGVNLASRIQSSAGEEEILVSEDVYRNIRNHEGIQAEFLGEKSFKNIKENTGIYRISASESYIPVLQPEEVQKGISREREPKPKLKKDKLLRYTVVVLSLIIIIGVVINRSRDHRPPDRLDQSVAVLPFKNYSGDKAYDYFTDGMTEEVINSLSKISGLKVISRTSVEQYKNSTKDTPTIAKELGVSNLLEGSIRKDSNRVKVTVQLIQARSRFHLWSDEYERNLSGIFSVQTEIAQKVAGVLAVVLTEREKTLIENRPSISITAYDFYMKARDERMYYEFGKGEGHLENAGDLYRKALRVDSTFAPAYAGLGWIYSFKHGAGEYFKSNYLDSAKMLAEKALKLDINCEDAYCLLGYYDYQHGNFESALKELDKAIEINPNYPDAIWMKSSVLCNHIHDYVQGLQYAFKAIQLDHGPKIEDRLNSIGQLYVQIGIFDKAEYYFLQATSLNGDSSNYYYMKSTIERYHKNYDKAITYIRKICPYDSISLNCTDQLAWCLTLTHQYQEALKVWLVVTDPDMILNNRHRIGYLYYMLGNKKKAAGYFTQQLQFCEASLRLGREYSQSYRAQYDLAAVYSFIGDKANAYHYLDLVTEQIVPPFWMVSLIRVDPMFNNLREEEHFQNDIKKLESKYNTERARVLGIPSDEAEKIS